MRGIEVFLIAQAGGRVISIRLLLAGVAVGYVLAAVTSFLIFMVGRRTASRRCCSSCSVAHPHDLVRLGHPGHRRGGRARGRLLAAIR